MVTLVLLPGMDGTSELFDPFIAALPTTIKVKTVRYPTDVPLNYAALKSLVRSELPPDGPYFILGESFSGPIAISLASAAPSGLAGLVLCCTFARNPHPAWSALSPLLGILPVGTVTTAGLNYFLLGRLARGELLTALARAVAQVTAPVLRARLQAVLSVNVLDKLQSVSVPVLCIRARHDRLVPARAAAEIASLLPRCEIADIAGPHCLLQVAPAMAAAAVSNFVCEAQNPV